METSNCGRKTKVNMLTYYIIDREGNISSTNDVIVWSNWFENSGDLRTVKKDTIGDLLVSTVFLGIPHSSNVLGGDPSEDYLFETMVFGNDAVIKELATQSREDQRSLFAKFLDVIDYQRRYKTLEEARKGHEETVSLVKKVVASCN